MKLRPGSIKKIKPDEIAYYSFSTHTLPLNLLAEYFKRDGYKVILLGIQPKNVSFGGALNPEVMESVRIIKEFFCEVLAINSLNCTYN
jgi:hydrogenase maturation protease